MTWTLTEELEQEILTWIEEGKGLRAYCRQEGTPSRGTIINWQNTINTFYTKCVRAREAAGELAAEDLEDINDRLLEGTLDPAAARVISSNKQWKASKLASKTYGDKSKVELGGLDGGAIQVNDITASVLALMTDEQLAQLKLLNVTNGIENSNDNI